MLASKLVWKGVHKIEKEYSVLSELQFDFFLRGLAPIVVSGYPTSSPYMDSEDIPYLMFSPSILTEGESRQSFESFEELIKGFIENITNYVGDANRVIVRNWPKIETHKIDGRPIYKVMCRLLKDDGTKELRTNLSTKEKCNAN